MAADPTPVTRLRLTAGPYTFDALASGPADSEVVLLLHGWPEFADCWHAVLPALGAAGYRALAVDQRGYSPDARPPRIADYAVPELVADALAFADSQGAERFHVVAHDWGGMVAWALAGAHLERLASLTVLATPHPRRSTAPPPATPNSTTGWTTSASSAARTAPPKRPCSPTMRPACAPSTAARSPPNWSSPTCGGSPSPVR
ncbi:alpha/beta fold hydrolase [Streptomyces albulus]|nr:alpha/beta fold hydrolase [Streptomyces noursei]